MTSQVSICNQALGLLGANFITSLDDPTTEGELCRLNYDAVRDAVLSEHNWTFATKWIIIPASADPPTGEYKNEFPIPPDVLTILTVGQDYSHQGDWQVESNAIRADTATCKCQVIYRQEDPTKYSAMFIQALVARLAAELATTITESQGLMRDFTELYARKVKAAIARDNQQGRSRRIRSRWLRDARFRDGTPWAGPYV